MADQAGSRPEAKIVLSPERQAEVLRTLMLNVSDRIGYLTSWSGKDKNDLQFMYDKAVEEVARIRGMLASGISVRELKGTSWAAIESGLIAVRDVLAAKKMIQKPKEVQKK